MKQLLLLALVFSASVATAQDAPDLKADIAELTKQIGALALANRTVMERVAALEKAKPKETRTGTALRTALKKQCADLGLSYKGMIPAVSGTHLPICE